MSLISVRYSSIFKKMNETLRVIITAIFGIAIGFFIGASLPRYSSISLTSYRVDGVPEAKSLDSSHEGGMFEQKTPNFSDTMSQQSPKLINSGISTKIFVPTNPRGAESLPPGIVESQTDLSLRRLWGKPNEDLPRKPMYLAVFTVGIAQKDMVNSMVSKFSENFTIILFHYDGKTSEWDQFEWSKRAAHVSARKQTKWWFAKRFLHPDVVAPYEYIFIWDEDLGVEHFDAEEYIKLVRKYHLEISQPAVEANSRLPWQMTKKRDDVEVHKNTTEKPGWCHHPLLPPCAGFVEIMAPVFSKKAWRCAWYMIQNDLVHGWGLDLALGRCVQPAYENIGVVDAQWIVHKTVPSLGNEGESKNGKAAWEGVRERCRDEWTQFRQRMEQAEKKFLEDYSNVDPKR